MINLEEFKVLIEAIEELKIKSENNVAIVVEGKNDTKALKSLGIRGEIFEVSVVPNYILADKLANREVVILTDWDEKGEKILKQIEPIIHFKNLDIRKKIISVSKKYIHSVEELPVFIEKAKIYLKKHDTFF